MTDCFQLMQKHRNRIDSFLKTEMQTILLDYDNLAPNLTEPVKYVLNMKAKRIRPHLVYLCFKTFCSNNAIQDNKIINNNLDFMASAIELIHCYSLVHDDLPAMDNDDLRRGEPTCHKKFSEYQAILAGDILQTLSFYMINRVTHLAEIKSYLIKQFSLASGDMAAGQALDMSAQKDVDLEYIITMHNLKTGALIAISVLFGYIEAQLISFEAKRELQDFKKLIASKKLQRIKSLGKEIGLLFQVQDDIIDIEAPTEILGKQSGSDINNKKNTFPMVLGIAGAKKYRAQLQEKIKTKIKSELTNLNNHNVGEEFKENLLNFIDYLSVREF